MGKSLCISVLVFMWMSVFRAKETHAWINNNINQFFTKKNYKSNTVVLSETLLDGVPIRGPITPLGNFCLIKTKEALTSTGGGILLPDQAKERPTEGEVLAAGPGKLHPHTGIRITNPVNIGDSVLYGKFDGTALDYDGISCQMIRDDDVMLYYKGNMMTFDRVIPCRDFVLVELEEEATETTSGIAIASAVTSGNLPCEGIIVKIGDGRMASNGNFTPSPVQPGDAVKFKDYAGNDVTIENKKYSLVRMVDILCTTSSTSPE
mmetsp:Transcript_33398/g.38004  ORF Transcript_33398/g.38004 Transcript_33398/m.38004 type:complete len:263 (+) Transcript_33398:152-940(+)|eukprot:CAMPEP_0194143472 /NCGR_PEP_ID=MMETSP0152-20130528/12647_1 /TAXON_ID=1049557 /ORGANISM="Thalassiothrix antarctica, Strain L6-D1" /LENGTH=262 /DNA_ID=CAMNT_0038842909 /DNA_START=107 /DNA_END=895 /DNA_ORIENTATION=-